ncbi:MAG TPA: hypothetical protein DCM05_15035 [Elusimicrobia bacterium]|nr:hypothetical protein [Elusimicrobiota bacterium]
MRTIQLLFFAAGILCLGCAMGERVPGMRRGDDPEAFYRRELLLVKSNQGKVFWDRGLYASYYWVKKSEYTDERGLKKRGLIAGLVLMRDRRGDSRESKLFTVHVGQSIAWEGYTLLVEEIKTWPKPQWVRIRIRRIEPAEAAPEVPAGNSQPQAPAKE